ncbi:MAG: hypothetical protein QOK39_2831 [Acidimicrobiaceae bacterium]|jgi:uncharacterized protein (TIGR03083 family)|nr:hypothetical protein [Acidimicrobiaceae bacterium]
MASSADDLAAARTALSTAVVRSAELIASLPDADARLAKSEWTVGEAASHLAIALRGFTDAATGDAEQWRPMIPVETRYADRVGGLNRATIAAEPRRSPAEAAEAIKSAAAGYLAATGGRDPAERIPTPWYGDGVSHSVVTATCLLLGEQVLHGLDIAKGVGRPWSISSDDARLVLQGIQAMMPIAVDPAATRGLTATYKVHVGGGGSFIVRISDGTATADIGPSDGSRVDCHIAGTPVALVLVGYGRISQWRAIGTGRLVAWGRKPWLGFRFVDLFFNP